MVVGLVVLFLHDISDVPIDALKMSNYAGLFTTRMKPTLHDEILICVGVFTGLTGRSSFFITEIVFVWAIISWFVCRIYIFPTKIILTTLPTDFPYIPGQMPPEQGYHPAATACRLLLVVLYCMHCIWFYMMLRIIVRMISEEAEEVADDEYEGGSTDSADEQPYEGTKKE